MRHDFRTLPPTIEELRAQCLRFHHRAPMAVCRDDVDDYSFDHCIICRSADTIAALRTQLAEARELLKHANPDWAGEWHKSKEIQDWWTRQMAWLAANQEEKL